AAALRAFTSRRCRFPMLSGIAIQEYANKATRDGTGGIDPNARSGRPVLSAVRWPGLVPAETGSPGTLRKHGECQAVLDRFQTPSPSGSSAVTTPRRPTGPTTLRCGTSCCQQ